MSGFSLEYEKIKVTYAPIVLGPMPGRWNAKKGETYYQFELRD